MPSVEELLNLKKPPFNTKEELFLIKAYDFAKKVHEGQKRDSGDPHFLHVFETAKNLIRLGMEVDVVAAGLLHDTIEDTNTTEEDLEREFNKDVARLVVGVTKLKKIKYKGNERYVESLRKFFLAIANDIRIVIIKLADRLHNINTLQYVQPEERQKRIAFETIEIHARLADRLGMGKLKGELEDAAFFYAYPKEYELIEKLLRGKKEIYEKFLEDVSLELKKELLKNKIKIFEINHRVKHKYSLWKKLLRHDMDIDKIYDVLALRVIVKDIATCYKVLGIVHSLWKPLPGRIKDYIALPKLNGYRCIHTTVFTGSGGIIEIQISTEAMFNEAAYGIAAHFIYKEDKENKFFNKDGLKWIEELKDFNKNVEKPTTYLEYLKTDFFNDRIFIFTPKGDVLDLPEGSSPIDFAYAIHSNIGNCISAVKVNNKIAPILSTLKSGDIVEIFTKKEAHPSSKWLDYAKTNVAKKNIRSYLEKNSLLNKLKSFGNS